LTDGYLASLLSALEDLEFNEILPTAKIFVSHARAIAALTTDFVTERNKRGGRP